MSGPVIEVNIELIEDNARAVTALCDKYDIRVTGVTKVTCGMPRVARALIAGGVTGIGESRLENIHRLRAGGITQPMMLLRIPPLSDVEEIVRTADITLNSEISVIRRLNQEAETLGVVHEIILMVDLGDLREGFWPEDLLPAVREILEMEAIRIRGLGTNLTCYGGVIPDEENLGRLVDYAHRIEDTFDFRIEIISGGNSSSLPLVAAGKMPKEVNNLRIGEAILLGRETIQRRPWPGTSQKAFVLNAELTEKKKKPSVPIGTAGQDAFGGTPVFQDRGLITRGILNIGREDVYVDGLTPHNERISILGASSGYLLLDLSRDENAYQVGDRVDFFPNYAALVAAMTSAYVEKRVILPESRKSEDEKSVILVGSLFEQDKYARELDRWVKRLGYTSTRLPETTPAREIADHIRPRSIPVLGGRDFTSLGLQAAAVAMKQFGLLWVDSVVTVSELHTLLGSRNDPVAEALDTGNIVFLGVREIEVDAISLIRTYNIRVYTMEDISLLPLRELMRQSLTRTATGTEGIYLKFGARVADNGNDGLTNREAHLIMEMTAASGALRILEMDDEIDPDVESPYIRTSRAACDNMPRFLLSALGKRILGNGT